MTIPKSRCLTGNQTGVFYGQSPASCSWDGGSNSLSRVGAMQDRSHCRTSGNRTISPVVRPSLPVAFAFAGDEPLGVILGLRAAAELLEQYAVLFVGGNAIITKKTLLLALSLFAYMAHDAPAADRLSKAWVENNTSNKIIYATVDEMPAGAEVRIRVAAAGTGAAPVVLLDYHDNGPSPHIKKFDNVSKGQVIKLRLDRKMRIGILVGTPASATCAGAEDKGSYHLLKYDFGDLGKYELDTKVIGQDF